MTGDEAVVKAASRLGDGDHKGEVEEELERGGRPMGLVGVSGRHAHVQLHRTILPSG